MASASFRESMNSLGWSRRESQAPVSTAPPSLLDRIQNLNPFADGGYVRLPTTETNPGAPLPAPSRREEEEGWFARKSSSFTFASFPSFPVVVNHVSPLVHGTSLTRRVAPHNPLSCLDGAMSSIFYIFSTNTDPTWVVARGLITRRCIGASFTCTAHACLSPHPLFLLTTWQS